MEYENLILQQLEHMDLNTLYQISAEMTQTTGYGGMEDLKEFVLHVLQGELPFDKEVMVSQLFQLLGGQFRQAFSACAMILVVCIISGIMNQLTASWGNQTVSRVGSVICLFVAVMVATGDFIQLFQSSMETLDLMIIAVQSLFPVLIPLILATGRSATAALLHPSMMGVIAMIGTVLDQWILPAVFYSCSLCIIGRITDQNFLSRTGKLMKDIIIFSMGLTVTVISGFTTLQGNVGKTADSLLLKTARYSADHLIPLIGGFAADSMDMVMSCTATIKNAIGLWGILLLLILMAIPLVKMAAFLLIYRGASIVAEALSENKVSSCLDDIASAVTTLFAVYLFMGILFIVFISILITIT